MKLTEIDLLTARIERLEAQAVAAQAEHDRTHMRLDKLLQSFSDGGEIGWLKEFAWLDEHHGPELWKLAVDIRAHGIREPILLGNDDRVWDGHHRLRVAFLLGLWEVPVMRTERDPVA